MVMGLNAAAWRMHGRRPWVPPIQNGLVLDFDPRSPNVDVSGSTLTSIRNQRGPVDFGAIVGSPTWEYNDPDFNGHPSIAVPSSGANYIEASGYVSPSGLSGYTVYAVATSPGTTSGYAYLFRGYNSSGGFSSGSGASLSNGGPVDVVVQGGSVTGFEQDAKTTARASVYAYRITDRGSSTDVEFYRNGKLLATNSRPLGFNNIFIEAGSRLLESNQGDFKCARLLVCEGRHSDADVERVSAYLMARYGKEFSLLDIADLALWLRADEGVTVDGSGNVSAWADRSGNGNDLVQATEADRPEYFSSGGPNGEPYIGFDGSDDFLRGVFTLAQPLHYFIVALPSADGSPANGDTLIDGASGNSGRIYLAVDGATWTATSDGVNEIQNNTGDTTVWSTLELQLDGASSSAIMDDGTPATGDCGTGDPGGVALGIFGDQASATLDCKVAELVICDRVLTSDERATVQSYLTARYGL